MNTNIANKPCSTDTTNVSPNTDDSLLDYVPIIECKYLIFNYMHNLITIYEYFFSKLVR